MLGLYPMSPASDSYVIGSPLFANVTLDVGAEQVLPVLAERLPALAERLPVLAERLPVLAERLLALAQRLTSLDVGAEHSRW